MRDSVGEGGQDLEYRNLRVCEGEGVRQGYHRVAQGSRMVESVSEDYAVL